MEVWHAWHQNAIQTCRSDGAHYKVWRNLMAVLQESELYDGDHARNETQGQVGDQIRPGKNI